MASGVLGPYGPPVAPPVKQPELGSGPRLAITQLQPAGEISAPLVNLLQMAKQDQPRNSPATPKHVPQVNSRINSQKIKMHNFKKKQYDSNFQTVKVLLKHVPILVATANAWTPLLQNVTGSHSAQMGRMSLAIVPACAVGSPVKMDLGA